MEDDEYLESPRTVQCRLEETMDENVRLQEHIQNLESLLQQAAQAGQQLAQHNDKLSQENEKLVQDVQELEREKNELQDQAEHMEKEAASDESHTLGGLPKRKTIMFRKSVRKNSDKESEKSSDCENDGNDLQRPLRGRPAFQRMTTRVMQLRREQTQLGTDDTVSVQRSLSADGQAEAQAVYEVQQKNAELIQTVEDLQRDRRSLLQQNDELREQAAAVAARPRKSKVRFAADDETDDPLRRLFDLCDVDGDGRLSVRELMKCCANEEFASALGVPPSMRQSDSDSRERLHEWLKGLDPSGDGEVSWTEFKIWVDVKKQEEAEEELRRNRRLCWIVRFALGQRKLDAVKCEVDRIQEQLNHKLLHLADVEDRYAKAGQELVDLRKRLGEVQLENEDHQKSLEEVRFELESERHNGSLLKERAQSLQDQLEEETRKRSELISTSGALNGVRQSVAGLGVDMFEVEDVPIEDDEADEDQSVRSSRKSARGVTFNLADQLHTIDGDASSSDMDEDSQVVDKDAHTAYHKELEDLRLELADAVAQRWKTEEAVSSSLDAAAAKVHSEMECQAERFEATLENERFANSQLRSMLESLETSYKKQLMEAGGKNADCLEALLSEERQARELVASLEAKLSMAQDAHTADRKELEDLKLELADAVAQRWKTEEAVSSSLDAAAAKVHSEMDSQAERFEVAMENQRFANAQLRSMLESLETSYKKQLMEAGCNNAECLEALLSEERQARELVASLEAKLSMAQEAAAHDLHTNEESSSTMESALRTKLFQQEEASLAMETGLRDEMSRTHHASLGMEWELRTELCEKSEASLITESSLRAELRQIDEASTSKESKLKNELMQAQEAAGDVDATRKLCSQLESDLVSARAELSKAEDLVSMSRAPAAVDDLETSPAEARNRVAMLEEAVSELECRLQQRDASDGLALIKAQEVRSVLVAARLQLDGEVDPADAATSDGFALGRQQTSMELEHCYKNANASARLQLQCRQFAMQALGVDVLLPGSTDGDGPGLVQLLRDWQEQTQSLRQEAARVAGLESECFRLRRLAEEQEVEEQPVAEQPLEEPSFWQKMFNQYNSTSSFCGSRATPRDATPTSPAPRPVLMLQKPPAQSPGSVGVEAASEGSADAAAGSSPAAMSARTSVKKRVSFAAVERRDSMQSGPVLQMPAASQA